MSYFKINIKMNTLQKVIITLTRELKA